MSDNVYDEEHDESKTWQFIAMWDMHGLESLINVTDLEHQAIVAALKGQKIKHSNPLQYMILRARLNPQRHYEIYAFNSQISEVSIVKHFKTDPQSIVNLIREKGEKIYSDRAIRTPVIT